MKKIKVLYLITRLNVGGAQEVALSLANGLDKNVFEVIFASGPQDFNGNMAKKWDINVTIIPGLVREINPIKDLMTLARLYFFIKTNRFDIVHTHTSKAGILGRLAAKLAGVPIIFHAPHGSIFHSIYYGPRTAYLLSKVEDFVASFTDTIVTSSENEREDFLEHGIASKDKYMTIYYGIKQDSFLKSDGRFLIRRQFNIPAQTILLGNISRLVPEKGHLFCLEAFRKVVDRSPKIMLLIVGEGVLRPAIEAKVKALGLEDKVIMAGHRDDVADILSSLDISLHTSIWEGTPIAIIEAMLMEKAIIATKVGGIPELIKDGVTGILIPAYDKEALARAIATLINDRALAKKLAGAACQYAKEKFGLETMIQKTEELYGDFLKKKF